ncbi:MAG: ATP-binding protein [Treponema sp.]|nr:ATP-binding protein [Treponema sp.]
MKSFINKWSVILKRNFREVGFVFLAFALMTAAAFFSVGDILRSRLLDRAEEMISTAEANVKAGLFEAQTILQNNYHFIQGMMNQNASEREILDYLTNTTAWMRQREDGLLSYNGIYAYLNDKFVDSIQLNPGSDYMPQARPWYQTAVRSGVSVNYTTPYVDWLTGETVVSVVRNIFDSENRIIGILALDIDVNWLPEYVGSLSIDSNGYGILVNQNMTLMTHPDSTMIGQQLQSLGRSYDEIAKILLGGEDILAQKITNKAGREEIVFFTQIFNGWYIGIITPFYLFYKDLYVSAAILIFLGLLLSIALSSMLLRFSAAKLRADERNKIKSSFIASMSHEIRTPINAITGLAELLIRSDLPNKARGYAKDIKTAGNNLISIVNDILDFSKIESGKLQIVTVKYSLSSLINDAVNIISVRLAEKPIQFNVEVDENIPDNLIGDEIKLRQILINLLSNAVKYTEKGEINLSISVENRIERQIWLKLKISDTGIGIKHEDQIKLFGDFARLDVKKNRGIEGTGLGLAIVKRICDAMRGDVRAESEYGKGSVFTVIIPQVVESEEVLTPAFNQSNDSNESGKNITVLKYTIPDVKILIVDDITTNLTVAEGLLSFYQAQIDTCLSGKKAIEMIKQKDYDLIFMDHMMPEMDGIEATEQIRAWERENRKGEKTLPIVMLTANAISGMREMYLQKGSNDFLAKPIDINKMNEIIDRWIPAEKRLEIKKENGSSSPESMLNIPGVDVKQGIKYSGGTLEMYKKVLLHLHKDIDERLPAIQVMPSKDSLLLFITHVHAIKSALAVIGEKDVSAKAAAIERAGHDEDIAYIDENLQAFISELKELNVHVGAAIGS